MLKVIAGISCLILGIFLVASLAAATDNKQETEMEGIVVTGERIIAPTKETAETVYTGIEVTKDGLKLGGEKASHNVWEAISILPGIMFESPDPANLATTQMSVRIRGVSGSLGSMSVEGIPIHGGNPIGPRTYILDLENFRSVALYRGSVPADLGPGTGTRGGALQLRPLWAQDKFGITLKESFGTYDYVKSFIRMDTGKLGQYGTKLSLSYSYAEEDKWRGKGEIGPRNNVNFTFVQPFSEKLQIKLWGNYNETKQHKFRRLTYAQSTDLDKFRRFDYTETLTGTPSIDWQYYDYNKLEWTNHDLYAFVDLKVLDNLTFKIKPYYREETKEDWGGTQSIQGPGGSNPGVQMSGWTVKRWGTIGEIAGNFNSLKALIGYQYEESEWKDSITENYWLQPGGSLQFIGWGRYTQSTESSPWHSPYGKVSGTLGTLNWQAGLKYMKMKDSANEGYITKYDAAGNPYLVREPKMDYGGKTYTALLPTAGLSYLINENLEVYTSFGRTFQRPYAYMPLINLYYALYPKFSKMGITLTDLFEEYKPEKTDNIDLGIRFRNNTLELLPTIHISRHKNLWTPITPGWMDPDDPTKPLLYQGKPVSYSTFVGKAKGYGFELGSNFFISDNITFFFNPSYTRLTYDGDIVSAGTKYNTDGRQVVDVPRFSLVSGIIVKYHGFQFTPIIRHIGKRYGDLNHKEKMPSYSVVDLKFAYDLGNFHFLKDFQISLEVDNLFNREYVVSTSYYPGAPFSVFGALSFKF